MASDRLYELAFEFKRTKLWNKISDDEVFAVKLSDGQTGFISIMGMAGDYIAIGVYIGAKGFNSYMMIADTYELDFQSQLLYQECLLQQDCLQCTLQNKDNLSREEAAEAKDYADRHGISLRGRNCYPQFVKYNPGYCPWLIQTKQDEQYIAEALEAAIGLAGMLKEKILPGIESIEDSDGTLIMLEPEDGGYSISSTEFPAPLPEAYVRPGISNDINVAKLKNTNKNGVWECELAQYPEPVRNEPEEVPHFPMMFLAVEAGNGFILPVQPVEYFEKSPDQLLDMVVEAFLAQNICPKVIHARDERSYYFLEELCKRIKTRLVIEPVLPELDKAEEDLLEHLYEDEEENMQDIMSVFDEIIKLSDEELKTLPDIVTRQFAILVKSNILPENLSKRLDEVFHFTENKDVAGNNKSNVIPITSANISGQSYVISVSCYKGCYRHIQISADSTLFVLHEAILDAFGFDDDHAHVFFMDNVKWSSKEAYYMEGMAEDGRTTGRYSLRQAGLEPGRQFKYLFDFGDCWLFQCKVLRVKDEDTDVPLIIRLKGEPPQQYPDYED